MNIRKVSGLIFLALLFAGGVAGGYFYFSGNFPEKQDDREAANLLSKTDALMSMRMYYPAGNQLKMEERNIPRRTSPIAIAEIVVEEYLKGPKNAGSVNMPKDARLLGLYKGADRILYIDISDEIRRNFQGDVILEYLLLKGLYESIISNVEDIQDVKVLIEGKEAETLGGHLYLLYPLKDMVSYEYQ